MDVEGDDLHSNGRIRPTIIRVEITQLSFLYFVISTNSMVSLYVITSPLSFAHVCGGIHRHMPY